MLSKEKIEYFKKKLNEEKKALEKELSGVGRRNPDVPDDWEATPADMNIAVSDKNELADGFEEMESRSAIENTLEESLNFVKKALERIDNGTYGICGECGKQIDEKRLEVYPAAKNCVKHTKNGK